MGPAGGPTVWEYVMGAGVAAFVVTFLTMNVFYVQYFRSL